MKKRKGIIVLTVVLAIVIAGLVTARLNMPRIEADKITTIVVDGGEREFKSITDKDKINEIVKCVNSKLYIPAIFIPKCIDNFKVVFYNGNEVYSYYTYGYETMHANDSVYWSKPETVEKIKELAGLKEPEHIPPAALKDGNNKISFSKSGNTSEEKGNREYRYVVKPGDKSLWLKFYVKASKGTVSWEVKNPVGEVWYRGSLSKETVNDFKEFSRPMEGEWIITTKTEDASGNMDIQWCSE